MALIGSRELQRQTKEILDSIERDGEPSVILRHGRPVAALIPVDQEHAEALVLGASPEFTERRRARKASGDRQVHAIEDVIRELDESEGEGGAEGAPAEGEAAEAIEISDELHAVSGVIERSTQAISAAATSEIQADLQAGALSEVLQHQRESSLMLALLVKRVVAQNLALAAALEPDAEAHAVSSDPAGSGLEAAD